MPRVAMKNCCSGRTLGQKSGHARSYSKPCHQYQQMPAQCAQLLNGYRRHSLALLADVFENQKLEALRRLARLGVTR